MVTKEPMDDLEVMRETEDKVIGQFITFKGLTIFPYWCVWDPKDPLRKCNNCDRGTANKRGFDQKKGLQRT